MQITALNGDPLSKFCFGCMQFGGAATDHQSQDMYVASRTAGINFFDTAHVYTGGASETLIGNFSASERDRLVIATKLAYTGGSGRQNILDMFAISQKRLQMDVVDILYLHRWDAQTCLLETFETLATLQSSGRIRHIGVSNFAAWQVMKAQSAAARFDTRIDIIQPMYSLVKRQAEVEIFPMAQSEGLSVAGYSPLGSGLLTGKYLAQGEGRLSTDTRYAARYAKTWMQQTAAQLVAYADEYDADPVTLAVAWAAYHPAVTAPIISARNAEQLLPSLKAMSVALTKEQYAEISAMSPTPAPATDRLEELATSA